MSELKINGVINNAPFIDVVEVFLKNRVAIVSFSLQSPLGGSAERVCNVAMSLECLKILEARAQLALATHLTKIKKQENPPTQGRM